jgi:hypothetical protein
MLGVFRGGVSLVRGSGRFTAKQEVTQNWGYVRIAYNTSGDQEEDCAEGARQRAKKPIHLVRRAPWTEVAPWIASS